MLLATRPLAALAAVTGPVVSTVKLKGWSAPPADCGRQPGVDVGLLDRA
jgi:hypothetical protein